ncbi:hypothetical protein ACFPT7_11355 [Acidicapsa dinghuensis]|uniref:Uncharacterized protein n=1 Tax=Acidicapsa dinghuensis TaxID=2218256 RepID=A0ABW1EGB9_9BACT|nr:hypothetical protein [Acidicapsa dinghuensis]
MYPWRRLTQFGMLAVAVAVLAQNPLPGPRASGVGGGSGSKPIVIQGSGTALAGTPPRNSGGIGYTPFTTDLTMFIDDPRREKLALYFTAEFQKKNVADTDRLVTLATEVCIASKKTGNMPTSEEMKKVELIERLARRVRERLTTP